MLGAIIGDIVGSRFEFCNHRSKDFDLFSEACFVTDDSVMTLAVAQAIVTFEQDREESYPVGGLTETDKYRLRERTVQCMQTIGRQYPDCGYGGMFARWMFSDRPQPYNSFGNGAAMRISPAGFAARSEAEAIGLARAVTAVTHNHPEGIKGAEAVAVAIHMARQGEMKDEIRRKMASGYYPLDFTIDEIRASYRFNETCQETVPQAIVCFLESGSFEDAIRT
ncbi:MAG: ADP-ribosylglycohydrolase family protein, partial [Eubacteriales bacterium]|nr:ADP-ribosylglycohydrolase family protein [Eubacteriales bacterium]